MKSLWTVVLVVMAAAVMPRGAKAQAEFYGGFADAKMTNLATSYTIPGFNVGLNIDGPKFAKRLQLAADIDGRFLNTSTAKLNSAGAGPRVTVNLGHGWAPYGAFLIGFGRYYSSGAHSDAAGSSTDSQLEYNVGVAKRVSPRFDVYGEFSYTNYFGNGGEYNPKVFSGGVIFHLVKR